ncbi:MAG TPA: TonB-dependent receptor [Longimicrobiaceae bacterium]
MSPRKRIGWMAGVVGAVMALAAGPELHAQVITGQLVDASTRDPVVAASIVLVAADTLAVDEATTDSLGQFTVGAEDRGEFRLLAQRFGYPETISTPLRLAVGDTLRVEFRISAAAVLLDPVVVQGRRRRPPPDIVAFYDRAERSISGIFLTREQIEAAHAMRASDLLRTVPGVQVGPTQFGQAPITIRGCVPLFIVDGVIARFERSIDNLVTPLDLEGLEIYRSPSQVPVEYGGLRSNCGAILIWTRRGP